MHQFPTDHRIDPRLCFRPSPRLPLDKLKESFESGELIATVRLGERDEKHPKGYYPGQIVTACLCEKANGPCQDLCSKRTVRITSLLVRPLYLLTPADLAPAKFYNDAEEVRSDFAFHEKKWIWPEEKATIVHFEP